jgi:hypothetical protein
VLGLAGVLGANRSGGVVLITGVLALVGSVAAAIWALAA